jgi:hypothetical protein
VKCAVLDATTSVTDHAVCEPGMSRSSRRAARDGWGEPVSNADEQQRHRDERGERYTDQSEKDERDDGARPLENILPGTSDFRKITSSLVEFQSAISNQ